MLNSLLLITILELNTDKGVIMQGNELLKDSAYCYHGCTITEQCKCNNGRGRIYKDTKGNSFCLDCNKEFID